MNFTRYIPAAFAALVVAGVAYAADYVQIKGSDGTNDVNIKTDSNGNLIASGHVASGATDSGNPVKVGGVYNSTFPTFTNGQRGDLQVGSRGGLLVDIMSSANGASSVVSNNSADGIGALTTLYVNSHPHTWNGSTYDRGPRSVVNATDSTGTGITAAGILAQVDNTSPTTVTENQFGNLRMSANGGLLNSHLETSTVTDDFGCNQSAVINVAAAATTQLVALSGSTVIRVCGFVVTGDTAATTATFVYGTGSNCATGQVALTGAMRMVDEGNISAPGTNGSLFRGAAANALCLTAATGAVTGFVSYAQY